MGMTQLVAYSDVNQNGTKAMEMTQAWDISARSRKASKTSARLVIGQEEQTSCMGISIVN